MREREPVRVQSLARKRNRPQRIGTVDVALLADERVAAQARLQTNLIAASRHELHFDQRRAVEGFDDAVPADRVLPLRIAWMRFLLNERAGVPDETVAPRAG